MDLGCSKNRGFLVAKMLRICRLFWDLVYVLRLYVSEIFADYIIVERM